jgi:hypothetical protein
MLFLALPALAAAQATVEYGLGAGRAATTAAPARAAGSAIGGAFGNLTRTLQNSGDAKPAVEHVTAAPSPAAPKAAASQDPAQPPSANGTAAMPPVANWEDPSGIRETMEYAEILQRFGPPTLKLTTGPGEEALNYVRKDVAVDVTLRDGKAITVRKSTQADHGIVRLQ